jgi:hypothetical protein
VSVSTDRPTKTPPKNQLNTVLSDDLYGLICRMSQALEVPRSEVVRSLVEQAVTVLRAAGTAEDAGQDREVAALAAVQQAAADEENVKRYLDRLDDYLTAMLDRDPGGAVQLARRASVALGRWAGQFDTTESAQTAD